MATFITIMGWLTVSLVALAGAALAVSLCAHVLTVWRDRRDSLVRALAARDLGRQLWSSGWWFTDDVKRALQLTGVSLQMHGVFDVEKIRDEWRKGDNADVGGAE